jgi:RNA polymerase sigma-70 factor (ECF subfamily)
MAFVRVANNTAEPDTEILQEAITTAYIEVERGRYERRRGVPFTAYVKGIARNKIREARRRQRRIVPLGDGPSAPPEGELRGMERVLEQREQLSLMREEICDLPPARRQVLERYLKGQSTEEIAHELGMTKAAVRQHKSRGVRSLRKRVGRAAKRRRANGER